jgi:hypothetical protein
VFFHLQSKTLKSIEMKTKFLLITLFFIWTTISNVIRSQTTVTATVTQPEILIADAGSDIALSKGQTYTLGGISAVTGGTAPYTYSWTPADGLSSTTISRPVVTANVTTSYLLTVTDARGCLTSGYVKITVGKITATNNIEAKDITVSPNPVTDIVTVELPASINNYLFILLNIDGRQIWNGQTQSFNSPVKQVINLGSAAPGLYLLHIKNGGNIWTQKIVKQ